MAKLAALLIAATLLTGLYTGLTVKAYVAQVIQVTQR